MVKISDLPMMPTSVVYRRSNGETFTKLNEAYHVSAVLKDDGSIIASGVAEEFDPCAATLAN